MGAVERFVSELLLEDGSTGRDGTGQDRMPSTGTGTRAGAGAGRDPCNNDDDNNQFRLLITRYRRRRRRPPVEDLDLCFERRSGLLLLGSGVFESSY
jgi:hypothetical protein